MNSFSSMIFKINMFNTVRTLVDFGVDPDFIVYLRNRIEFMIMSGITSEEVFRDHLPKLPPYIGVQFGSKKDADMFCDHIKTWYNLDYKSKATRKDRWIIHYVR